MAILKNTTIDSQEFLKLPQGTENERSNNTTGNLRFNSETNKIEIYNGFTWKNLDNTLKATSSGDVYKTEIIDNGVSYSVHVFYGNGNFIVSNGGEVEYLIVAGGGGGRLNRSSDPSAEGGGGGAGGVILGKTSVSEQTYSVTVGEGGTGGTTGSNGGNSSIFGLTAIGGGAGGDQSGGTNQGNNGGSGGGGSGLESGGVLNNGGSGTDGQGNDGGYGYGQNDSGTSGGGGGGGSAGENADSSRSGAGGNGLCIGITGYPVLYAGGGGGGSDSRSSEPRGSGGLGGGGRGGEGTGANSTGFGTLPGAPNTGGGGGGCSGNASPGGDGGSGIVVVRYKTDQSYVESSGLFSYNLVFDLDAGDPLSYDYGNTPDQWIDKTGFVTDNGMTDTEFTGRYGGAIVFNGSTSRVGINNWPNQFDRNNEEFSKTWEIIARTFNAGNDTQGIFGHKVGGGCSNYCYGGIKIYEGEWTANWYDHSTYRWLKSGITANFGEWAHVVAAFDANDRKFRIYVNGELENTFNSPTQLTYSGGQNYYELGYDSKNGGKHHLDGEISIARYYDSIALGEVAIKQNFNYFRGRFGL